MLAEAALFTPSRARVTVSQSTCCTAPLATYAKRTILGTNPYIQISAIAPASHATRTILNYGAAIATRGVDSYRQNLHTRFHALCTVCLPVGGIRQLGGHGSGELHTRGEGPYSLGHYTALGVRRQVWPEPRWTTTALVCVEAERLLQTSPRSTSTLHPRQPPSSTHPFTQPLTHSHSGADIGGGGGALLAK